METILSNVVPKYWSPVLFRKMNPEPLKIIQAVNTSKKHSIMNTNEISIGSNDFT